MKRIIWNSIGVGVLAAAIAFSLIQLNIPVVRAESECPPPESIGCNCLLVYSLHWIEDGVEHRHCHYECGGCSGGGGGNEHFVIQQEACY
ncbi:MAG: hypothetical protein WAQ99_21735 [Pyrinomonadaceae bacterium]